MEIVATFARNFITKTSVLSLQGGSDVVLHTQTAVIAREFTRRTSAVEVNLADAADVVLGDIPAPSGDRIPIGDLNFHFDRC